MEIKGIVESSGKGSIIRAKIRLSLIQMFLKGVMFSILGFAALIFVLDMINTHHFVKQGIAVYVFMIVLPIYWLWDFNMSVGRAKEKITAIVNGTIVPN